MGSIPANGNNTLQFWVRRTSGSGGSFTVYVVDGTTTTTSTTYYGQTSFSATGSWAMVSVSINNTAGAARDVFLRIDKSSGTGEWEFTGFNMLEGTHASYQTFNVGTELAQYDDIESYMISANWQIGMGNSSDYVASEGTLSVELRNTDYTFSIENSVSPFYGGVTSGRVNTLFREGVVVLVEVYDESNTTWYPFWRGFLSDIDVASAPGATATLSAEQGLFRFDSVKPVVPVLENSTADQIIAALVNSGWVVSAYPNAAVVSKIAFSSDYFDVLTAANVAGLDTGTTTYRYVGEEWHAGDSKATDILRDLMQIEQGLFFLSRDGIVTFYHRDRIYSDGAAFGSYTTLTDSDINDCVYDYVVSTYNAAKVDYYPKETVVGEVWRSRVPIDIEAYGNSETTARFEYEEGSKVTVLSINPFSGDDASTFTATDENGDNVGGAAISVETHVRNGEAVVNITSFYGAPVKVDIVLKGTILVSYGGRSMYVNSFDQQLGIGAKVLSISNKLIDNEQMAKNVGAAAIAGTQRNYGTFTDMTITSRNASWLTRIRSLTLGSRVSLSETNTGATHKMIIVGEAATWSPGILSMQYKMRPTDNVRFATLDETTTGYMELAY